MQLKSHIVELLPTWHPQKGKETNTLSQPIHHHYPAQRKPIHVFFWQLMTAVSTLPETDSEGDEKRPAFARGTNPRPRESSRVPYLGETSRRRDPGHRRAAPTGTIPAARSPARASARLQAKTCKARSTRHAARH
jgi:hypothetical protein